MFLEGQGTSPLALGERRLFHFVDL